MAGICILYTAMHIYYIYVYIYIYISDIDLDSTPQPFYTRFYNQARRLRLEKLLYLELSISRSSNIIFKPLLDPGGRCI